MTASPGSIAAPRDQRVERDDPEAGAGQVEAADQLAELGQLAADDLDPRLLGAARQARADLLPPPRRRRWSTAR